MSTTVTLVNVQKNPNKDGLIVAVLVANTGVEKLLPGINMSPSTLTNPQIQTQLDARAEELWTIAQTKGYPKAQIWKLIATERVMRSLAILLRKQINVLRAQHGLAALTDEDVLHALCA